jgi:hypothetical protein
VLTGSRAKSVLVLARNDERLDHFSLSEVAVELVQLREPEVVAIEGRVWLSVWISAQITDVFHIDEGAIELTAAEVGVFGDSTQYLSARVCRIARHG